MDPNLAQPVPAVQPTNPQSPDRNRIILIIIIVSILALILLGLNYSKLFQKVLPKESPISSQTTLQTPTPNPDPRLGQITIVDGKVVKVTKDSVTLQTTTGGETFTLDQVVEIRFASGGKATVGNIKRGQKIRITGVKNSNAAKLISILEEKL